MPETSVIPKPSKKTIIILGMAIIILAVLNVFSRASYKKVVKENATLTTENTTLNTRLASMYSFTVTKTPMSVDGQIVYKTVTKYIKKTLASSQSSHSSSVSIVTKEVTITKRDFATFALGTDLNEKLCFSAQRDIQSTPIGTFGLMVSPNTSSLKETRFFLTYKP